MILKPTGPMIAHLDPPSPRAERWRTDFGGLSVEIWSPATMRSHFPGKGIADCYLVKITALEPGALARIGQGIATDFAIPVDEVLEGLHGGHGLPILAEDVTVTFDARRVL